MSAATAHAPAVHKEEFFRYSSMGPVIFGLFVGTGVGLLLAVLGGFFFGIKQFLFSWLFAFMFFFTISMGALFWTMVHYAFDAEWSVVVRRLLETVANSFTWIWLAFIPLLIWAPKVWEWMNISTLR